MSSGENNKSNQPNTLPAVSGSSLRTLSNQVQVLDDVLKERNPWFWYENALKTIVNNDNTKALYYCNKAILCKADFAPGYLLRLITLDAVSKKEWPDFDFYSDLASSFQVDFIKSFIENQFSTSSIFPFSNEFYDTELIEGKAPIQYYYGKVESCSTSKDLQRKYNFNRERYFFQNVSDCYIGCSEEFEFIQTLTDTQKSILQLSMAANCVYIIQENLPKSTIIGNANLLVSILNNQQTELTHLKWIYIAAAVFSRYISQKKIMIDGIESPKYYLGKAIQLENNFLPAQFFLSLDIIANKGDSSELVNIVLDSRSDIQQELRYFFAKHYENFEQYAQAQKLFRELINEDNIDLSLKSYCFLHLGNIETRLNDDGLGYDKGYAFYLKVEELGLHVSSIPYRGLAWKYKRISKFYEAAMFYFKGALAHPIHSGGELIEKAIFCLKLNGLLDKAISEGIISQSLNFFVNFITTSSECKKSVEELYNDDPNYVYLLGLLYKSVGELSAITSHHEKAVIYYSNALELFRRNNIDTSIIQQTLNLKASSFLANSQHYKASNDLADGQSY